MSILSVDNISPIGSGTSVTVNSAATLVLTNANSTGVVTATSFVGSGANLTGVLSNIVEDTSPQLGGNLDTNSHEISLDTSHAINFGDSNELQIKYHGGNGQIDFNGNTGPFIQYTYARIQSLFRNYNKEVIIVFTQTDFPDPVVPAINK